LNGTLCVPILILYLSVYLIPFYYKQQLYYLQLRALILRYKMICNRNILLTLLISSASAFTSFPSPTRNRNRNRNRNRSPAFHIHIHTKSTSTSLDAAVKKVFIDGETGTTGLQVRERLSKRDDIEIISPPSELRKDDETRKKFINEADAVILCLPDDASIEAASWVEAGNDRTVLIDASTAFRVDDTWTYGFPG
jgi:hypothetical protein